MRLGSAFFASALFVVALLLPPIAQASVTITADRVPAAESDFPVARAGELRLSSELVPIDWQNFNISPSGNVSLQQPPAARGVLTRIGGEISLAGLGLTNVLEIPDRLRVPISQVPEPSSGYLLLAGALLLGGVARRRFRNLP